VLLETRGYRVIACASGERALDEFHRGSIDLVLTDLVMPGMNGADLIARIKALSPETPAILFSGQISECPRLSQADLFLPKGTFAPAELLERIRLLLVRKRRPRRAAVQSKGEQTA